MSGKIDIMNRALGWLGQPPINNPETPSSTSGKAVADIYELVRRAVLAKYYWNFAEVTANTVYLGESEGVYDDDYLYPENCLKLIRPITDTGYKIEKWRIGFSVTHEKKIIQINNSAKATLKLIYNYDQKNIGIWSPLAQEVFALYLALGACNSILGKENQMLQVLNGILTEELKDAISVDGQEQPFDIEEIYQVERARLGYLDYENDGSEGNSLLVNFS